MKSYRMSCFFRRVTAFTLLLLLSLSIPFPAAVRAGQEWGTLISISEKYLDGELFSQEKRFISSPDDFIVVGLSRSHASNPSLAVKASYVIFKNPGHGDFEIHVSSDGGENDYTYSFMSLSDHRFVSESSDIYYVFFVGSGLEGFTDTPDKKKCHDLYDVPCDYYYNLDASCTFNYGTAAFSQYLFGLYMDNRLLKDLDPDSDGTLSTSIPTPKIHVNKDYSFGFDNCTDDYYIQMQGRFWSVDDIELYKENMMWKYRYNSSIKGDLNDWYTAGSKTKANSGNLSFLENGQACFDEFLQQHPVNERSFYGGTNAVGNYFSGYNNALDTIKMLLGQPTSGYNGVDVYVRYFTYTDTGDLIYGKWCHYYDDIAKNGSSGSEWDDDDTLHNSQQSVNGMTDREKEENEKNDDPRKSDLDATLPTPDSDYKNPGIDIDFDSDLNFWTALNSFSNILNSSMSLLGDVPAFVSTVFGFLPSSVIVIISLGIISVIILRFIGR